MFRDVKHVYLPSTTLLDKVFESQYHLKGKLIQATNDLHSYIHRKGIDQFLKGAKQLTMFVRLRDINKNLKGHVFATYPEFEEYTIRPNCQYPSNSKERFIKEDVLAGIEYNHDDLEVNLQSVTFVNEKTEVVPLTIAVKGQELWLVLLDLNTKKLIS